MPGGSDYAAGSVVVQAFSPWLNEPAEIHPSVATLIGLDEYAIIRRPFGDYTSRADQFGAWLRSK